MPEILVAATDDQDIASPTTFLYRERVTPAHVQDEHAAAQLMERVSWAIADAEQAEQDHRDAD